MNKRKQLVIALSVYLLYVGIILLSNIFMKMSVANNNETYEMVSGILFGFIGIPVFSIFLPIWLSKKWKLDFSFWPKNKNLLVVISILIIYILLANFESIKTIIQKDIQLKDFIIHYISAMMFHVTYYPLFAMLIFPVIRKNFGLEMSLIFTSLAFCLYHIAQFHFFPAGITPLMQILLFIAFITNLLFYLWSESLLLIALVHSTNGAIGLIANGTIFNQIDFLFYLTILIIGTLFGYMIVQIKKKNDIANFNENWWLRIMIE